MPNLQSTSQGIANPAKPVGLRWVFFSCMHFGCDFRVFSFWCWSDHFGEFVVRVPMDTPEKDCMKVAVNIRPLITAELQDGYIDCVTVTPGEPQVPIYCWHAWFGVICWGKPDGPETWLKIWAGWSSMCSRPQWRIYNNVSADFEAIIQFSLIPTG